MTRRLLLWFLLLGCSSTQIGNEVDAGLDASPVDSAVEEDVVLDAPDAQDIADTPAVPDARDVPSVPDRPVTRNEAGCAIDPPSGPPPEVGRSCGEGRAPSRHCNEVSYCGGTYTVGSLDAHFVTVLTGRNANHPSEEIYSTFRMRSCDLHPGRVEGGYVDAYEVTVARYRAWVNAGMPTPFRPRMNISFFWGGFWNSDLNNEVPRAGPFTGEMIDGEPVSASHCTWTDQPGANEDRPITCIGMAHAVAFCEWEGKHLITSTAWEFLARNRGTTSTPAGEAANNSNRCDLGNVGRTNGVCTRAILPEPVGSSPRDVTVDPPGVYDLYGNVSEYVLSIAPPYAWEFGQPTTECRAPAMPQSEYFMNALMARGGSWLMDAVASGYFEHMATTRFEMYTVGRQMGDNTVRSPGIGFRCARFVPEPPTMYN
jgi:formylglycine-generating enzyme required for sulfatase activity